MGTEQQMMLELRPARDPKKAYRFVGVVISLKDLSSSIWMWHRDDSGKNGKWAVRKVIEISAEPAEPEVLPPLLQGFKAVPPLVSDSLDDGSSTFRAGVLANFFSTTLQTQRTRRKQDPSTLEALSDVPLIRRSQSRHSMAGLRWPRTAVTASVYISPTRFTRRGTSSSIPMERRAEL